MCTYLEYTVSSNLSLNKEIDRRIGRAVSTLARLGTSVFKKPQHTSKTKVSVYKACVHCTLLYKSESLKPKNWISYISIFKVAAWDIKDEQATKHSCVIYMWITNNFYCASLTQTVLARICLTNERRKNPQKDVVQKELIAGKCNSPNYATGNWNVWRYVKTWRSTDEKVTSKLL